MIFLLNIVAQNIDCGYTLEPPIRSGSKEDPPTGTIVVFQYRHISKQSILLALG